MSIKRSPRLHFTVQFQKQKDFMLKLRRPQDLDSIHPSPWSMVTPSFWTLHTTTIRDEIGQSRTSMYEYGSKRMNEHEMWGLAEVRKRPSFPTNCPHSSCSKSEDRKPLEDRTTSSAKPCWSNSWARNASVGRPATISAQVVASPLKVGKAHEAFGVGAFVLDHFIPKFSNRILDLFNFPPKKVGQLSFWPRGPQIAFALLYLKPFWRSPIGSSQSCDPE